MMNCKIIDKETYYRKGVCSQTANPNPGIMESKTPLQKRRVSKMDVADIIHPENAGRFFLKQLVR